MDSVFQQAIAKFEKRLTEEQRLQLPKYSREDVEKTIADIQANWGSKRRLRNMNRLSKFLEAMTQLGHVIEVFLNVNSTVALIWGPIKFLLLIASTWIDGLEKLLETYTEIGEVLPPLKEYQSLFKNHRFVLSYLESYYCDILEFHSIAFDVFARPVWKEVFRSSWKTFETRFGPILNSMRRHKALLSEEKLTAIQAEVQAFRGNFEDRFEDLARLMKDRDDAQAAQITDKEFESRRRKIAAVLDNLKPPDYLIDQEHAVEQWQSSDSGAWVIEEPSFQQWLQPAAKSVLYLNGIPGAGKSVLVSRMVHHLQQARLDCDRNNGSEKRHQTPAFSLVYFYFKHQEPRKRQLTDLLAAATAQLMQQDDSIIDHVFSKYCTGDQSKLRSSRNLLELVQMLVRTQQSCIFVLDGLDECTGNSTKNAFDEREKVLNAVFSLFPTDVSRVQTNKSQQSFRLLVSGQRDGYLDHKFKTYPAIHLEKSRGHSNDIESYAEAMIQTIAKRFPIKQDTRSLILKGVHEESKGMFLYAKIVLNNLLHQVSISGLKQELHKKRFPKGLHEAYERVVASVFDNPEVAERDAATEIIKLVAVAERPLRWREIQAKFCIDLDREASDPDSYLQVQCKTLCRSLVDVVHPEGFRTNANDTIHLVHSTALELVHPTPKLPTQLGASFLCCARDAQTVMNLMVSSSFLVQTGRLSLQSEHARIAMFCGSYLGSRCLRLDSNAVHLEKAILTGYLGLHDYASAFWFEHFIRAIKDIHLLAEKDQDCVKMALFKLRNAYALASEATVSHLGVQWLQELPRDARDRFVSVPAIASIIESIRTAIETVRDTDNVVPGETSLDLFYGPPTFKCSKPWCEFFSTGFPDKVQRKQHVREHDRPFRCEEESCYAYSFGFATEKKLSGHMQFAHSENIDSLSEGSKMTFPDVRSSRGSVGDLCAAAADGDLARVKALIKYGANFNAPSKAHARSFPLNIAAEQGHLQVCQYLLQSGANINRISPLNQDTALIIASLRGDMDLVSLLLDQQGIKVWHYDRNGWSALGHAVAKGHAATVNVFRTRVPKHEFYAKVAGPEKSTGLSIAISEGKEEIVELFLQHLPPSLLSPKLFGGDENPLDSILKRGNWKIAQMLLHTMGGKGILDFDDRDLQGMLPLQGCSRMTTLPSSSTNLVDQRVPENVSSINPAGQCYIMSSIGNVPRPLVHRMLKSPSARLVGRDTIQRTLLHYACYAGDSEAVRILLAYDQYYEIDVNSTMSHWPTEWEPYWPRPEGPIGLNAITCAMVGYGAGEERREILRMLLDIDYLQFPDDNQIFLLETCSRAEDGLLLWRLVRHHLPQLSIPHRLSSTAPSKFGEMYRLLLRDQILAENALKVDRDLIEETLGECSKVLKEVDSLGAIEIALEHKSLPFKLTTEIEGSLQIAYSDGDTDTLQRLRNLGLTLTDIASYTNRTHSHDILEWALQGNIFNVNEVNRGKSVLVYACLKQWYSVVDRLLKFGTLLERQHIIDAINELKNRPTSRGVHLVRLLEIHI